MEIYGPENRVNIHDTVAHFDTFINTNCGDVNIGEYSFISHRCMLITGSHNIKDTGLARQLNGTEQDRHINIGKGVWIGSGVIILGPCTIGDNSVVGAGSVVLSGEYPADTLIAGNPAKVKKTIQYN